MLDEWRNLCRCEDVREGHARGFSCEGQDYIVVHYNGHHYVYINRCPHLQIPLEWQPDRFLDPDGELLRCATHGALFLMDTGECVSGPCVGQRLSKVPHRVQDGSIAIATAQSSSLARL